MASDMIQIGSLIFSKSILDVLSPLFGTFIGGLITYFVARSIENQKWEKEKKDRLSERKREALAQALDWIDPMELAVSNASMLISSHLSNVIDQENFQERWPYLLGELKKYDLPQRLRVFLPLDAYPRAHQIVKELGEIQIMGVKYGQESKRLNTPMLGLDLCGEKLDSVMSKISSFKDDLTKEFMSTYH